MKSFRKTREILLDEEIDESEFAGIISEIYKQNCYIYAIIPDWEEELLNDLADDFTIITKVPFPLWRVFPRTVGVAGYVRDREKQHAYEFYLRSAILDFLVFSEFDASEHLKNINKRNYNLYKIFESNEIPHVTIGPDGQWLNVVEYGLE